MKICSSGVHMLCHPPGHHWSSEVRSRTWNLFASRVWCFDIVNRSLIYSWGEVGTLQEDVVICQMHLNTSTVPYWYIAGAKKPDKPEFVDRFLFWRRCALRVSQQEMLEIYWETNVSVRKISKIHPPPVFKLQSLYLNKFFCYRIRCRKATCFPLPLYSQHDESSKFSIHLPCQQNSTDNLYLIAKAIYIYSYYSYC